MMPEKIADCYTYSQGTENLGRIQNSKSNMEPLHIADGFTLMRWKDGHQWQASTYSSPIKMMSSWITHECHHWAEPIEVSYGSHPIDWACRDCEKKVPDELKALYILHNGLI